MFSHEIVSSNSTEPHLIRELRRLFERQTSISHLKHDTGPTNNSCRLREEREKMEQNRLKLPKLYWTEKRQFFQPYLKIIDWLALIIESELSCT